MLKRSPVCSLNHAQTYTRLPQTSEGDTRQGGQQPIALAMVRGKKSERKSMTAQSYPQGDVDYVDKKDTK